MLESNNHWLPSTMTNGTRNDLQFLSDHTNNSQLATYVKPAWASLSLVISKYSFL